MEINGFKREEVYDSSTGRTTVIYTNKNANAADSVNDAKSVHKRNLTKIKIANIAFKIQEALFLHEMDDAFQIFFNGQRVSTYKGDNVITKYVHARDWCGYAPEYNIITFASEGGLYDYYNYHYDFPEWLSSIWEKEGLYAECNESWNWSLYPDDFEEFAIIEYDYKKEEKTEYIYLNQPGIPKPLNDIMSCWYNASEQTGDLGGCVLGAGMKFKYHGINYKMRPASPYQGEGSWTPWINMIKEMLKSIGATEIEYEYGRLD